MNKEKLISVITLIFCLVSVAGCTSAAAGPPPENLTILFSADTRGELYKCGCKSNQIGGIARRGTVIKELEPGARVIIDCGNLVPGSSGLFYDLKSDAIIDSYLAMGYDAVNIGANEISLGKDFILKANAKLGNIMISANVLDPSGNTIVQPYITRDFGSLRVGIIGLTYHQAVLSHPSRGQKSTVITREPLEALDTYLPEMKQREKCDLIIVAGWIQEKDVENIAEKYDGQVDVILSGYGFKPSDRKSVFAKYYRAPETTAPGEEEPIVKRDKENEVETSIILHRTGNSGKYVGKIFCPIVKAEDGSFKIGEADGSTVEIGDQLADDPQIDAILDGFHAKVRENIDTLAKYVIGQNVVHYCKDYPDYVGNRWCNDCHSGQAMSFNRSAHNQAMQPLNQKKEQRNPECLVCHTTGFGEPGGFINNTDSQHLLNVGCESCHGSAKEHLCLETDLKEAKKASSKKTATEKQLALIESMGEEYDHKIRKEVPKEICLKCHTPEWSPNFDYDKLLPIVAHPQEMIEGPATDARGLAEMQRAGEADGSAIRDPGTEPPEGE